MWTMQRMRVPSMHQHSRSRLVRIVPDGRVIRAVDGILMTAGMQLDQRRMMKMRPPLQLAQRFAGYTRSDGHIAEEPRRMTPQHIIYLGIPVRRNIPTGQRSGYGEAFDVEIVHHLQHLLRLGLVRELHADAQVSMSIDDGNWRAHHNAAPVSAASTSRRRFPPAIANRAPSEMRAEASTPSEVAGVSNGRRLP